jgi:ABC-type Mn2+/Zn2+ transport system ATPase subunit
LAFIKNEKKDIPKFIGAMIGRNKNGHVSSEEFPLFFSILPKMQSYRDACKSLKCDKAKNVLLSINDLVAVKHFGKIPLWYDEVISTDEFRLSFMRNSEAFFAFQNAWSVLDGLEFEELNGVTDSLSVRFKLDGFNNEHILDFSFNSDRLLPKRISVIIGKNGTGKSQSLSQIVQSALRSDSSLTDASGNRPQISRIVAIGTPGEGRVTFPQEQRGNDNIFYRRLLLNRNRGNGWRGIGEMLVQLARSSEEIGGKDRWQIFCNSLEAIMPLEEIGIPLREGSDLSRWRNVVTTEASSTYINVKDVLGRGEQACLETWGAIHQRKDPVRLIGNSAYPLSSGQLAFLRFAALASLYIENGTLLLLDEPEIHLHPNMISSFVLLLDSLLEWTGSISIISTHSVYFVREVPRSQVIVLRQDDNKRIEAIRPRLKTLGADIGSISFFVFEDRMSNTLVDKFLKNNLADKININDLLEELSDELSPEAIMEMRRKFDGRMSN